MTVKRIAAVAAVAVLGAACGSGGSTDQRAAGPKSSTLAAASTSGSGEADRNEIPDAVVRDVASGAEINIRSLAPAAEPILFWFYAPH